MKKLLTISSICLVMLAGCSTSTQSDGDKIQIITSYYPYALVAEQIGGDFVEVESVYPVDSDAHSYEITPAQTMSLQDADLIIITNEEEDSTIYNSLKDNDNVLSVVEDHDDDEDHDDEDDHDDDHEHAESHSWLSPLQMEEAVSAITDSLIELDETNKLAYTEAAGSLQAELQTVNADYQAFGAEQTKSIVATHDAYETLTDDYGIEFVTLYGAHHDDEPTTKDIIDTVDLIKEQSINTIFVEQDDPSNKVMRQIADEAAIGVDTLYTLESESSSKSFNSIIDFYNYNLEMFEKGQK